MHSRSERGQFIAKRNITALTNWTDTDTCTNTTCNLQFLEKKFPQVSMCATNLNALRFLTSFSSYAILYHNSVFELHFPVFCFFVKKRIPWKHTRTYTGFVHMYKTIPPQNLSPIVLLLDLGM